ncbi:hypothetical protein ACJMK2_043701 [Sinanodonta woodiana]|uniref:Uncharacterized protein n=1 Tax=Sinanodonta woodiana TaxID=1069815 RepID=A0ABD3VYI8_SINWO
MLHIIQFTCSLVVFYGIGRALGQALPDETLYTDNACYGSSANYSYFTASCSTNHAIAVSNVLGGAKPYTATSCPPEVEGNRTLNFSDCCVLSRGDCIEEFPEALKTYHDGCSGEQACTRGTSARRFSLTKCQEPLVNNTYTSYLELDYYCINKTTIGSTCTSVSMTTSGKALYLWNNGYPNTASADCNCSIEVNSSTAQINVTAMRTEFVGNSSIRFLDGVCDAKETILFSNVSTITNTFISTSNYLLMKYTRGQINDTARYWLRFKATNSSANLIVQCQPESKPVCTTTTSTTTATSTTTSTTTPSTTTSTTSTPSTTTSTTKTPSTTTIINTTTSSTTTTTASTVTILNTATTKEKASESVMIGIIIGVICLLILIVAIVIIIIYRRVIIPARNRRAAEEVNNRDEQSTEPSDYNKESMIEQGSLSGGKSSAPPAATLFTPRTQALSLMLTNSNGLGSNIHKKHKKKRRHHRDRQDNPQRIEHAGREEEENGMSYHASLPTFEIYNENGEGRGRKNKKKKRKEKKHSARADDVDDQDLEQDKEEMHMFESKVHPELQEEQEVNATKEEKKKKKKRKKRKKHIEEEEGKEMKHERTKTKRRHKHTEDGQGVQNGEEETFSEEKKEIYNDQYEEGMKRKHHKEEYGVLNEEVIREKITTKHIKHSEDSVPNDEDRERKRKKRKKKQRLQKEETEDGGE